MSAESIQAAASVASETSCAYIKAHPYQSIFMALNIGLAPVLGSGWLTAPLLNAIGFGPLGPIAGKNAIFLFRLRY